MKRWWLVLALVLSVGINVGILSMLALRRVVRPPELPAAVLAGPERQVVDEMARRLGLEGEQRERFVAIQQQFFQGMADSRRQVAILHGQLRREVGSRRPDRQRLDEITAQLGQRFMERERLIVDTVLNSRELLNRRQRFQYELFFSRLLPRLMEGQPRPPGDRWRPGGWPDRPQRLPPRGEPGPPPEGTPETL